ncbi:tRNA (N6-threonylcarbamoyladenosine(37)-N6)-methyltransferase TrmO [Geopsychrobacter electrodiphilus]|uniref:tRNA (N6-threonylcarbamoyladenosine(37)-N6)-methyltransferase TrmO n=1 Tax=Geopsychrobacter electrodiphilus TaxID=225196 RepID=UPI00037E4F85|nr:tRNA (N6-threonylcarbamoyladenosine(37)-N6)-methyltransferase TrmO [Geopsychrobacter electrodiphilus]
MEINLKPIGVIHSPYKEKFAVPRQAGLAPSVEAELELLSPYNQEEFFHGLEDFSHIWLIFLFHQNLGRNWHPTVRPPRLGGNKRVGVFASRSPFRPNPIGLSAVELIEIFHKNSGLVLRLRGADLVDGTPIIDIKPYLPYSDALSDAKGAFAKTEPVLINVKFSPEAEIELQRLRPTHPQLRKTIIEMLAQDPRPAYRGKGIDTRSYGVRIYDLNLNWKMDGETALVSAISPI